jgi:hypothetical protein
VDQETRDAIRRLDRRVSAVPATTSQGAAGAHTHPESEVSGLTADLAAKAASGHTHTGVYDAAGAATAAVAAIPLGVNRLVAADATLAADYSLTPVDYFEVAAGVVFELAAGAVVEVVT